MTRIVFMGSPDFALPTLRALASAYNVVGVVTQPDRAAGRGRELKPPPVKVLALELNLPVIQPEKLRAPEAMSQLREWNPDLIIVAAFGQILKPDVLNLPRFGCINVHASLLPRWRGAAPIQAAILAGDEETGVTIMKMDAGLDTGPILAKRAIRLKPDDTAGSVFQALSTLGADLLLDILPDYLAGKLTPTPQPAEGVTYAPMLKKEDGRLDFTRPAAELERKVRAFNPWPGAWFEWNGSPLKVMRGRIVSVGKGLASGTRLTVEGRPAVMCADAALVLEEVQPAGKKVMDGKSFLAGGREWK
ncbi:MAG: methionyl-tRNA formyltransferase [Chloroflexota bacterium]|nr:methionyl-tRNA formyltransferase [Chloroflexota bacterium]MBI5702429.1 methionyl-tRNA formyltransferase [Chloroflexota bacterium]